MATSIRWILSDEEFDSVIDVGRRLLMPSKNGNNISVIRSTTTTTTAAAAAATTMNTIMVMMISSLLLQPQQHLADTPPLFTAVLVPVELAIKTIEKKWNILEQYTNIPRGLFIEILKFCIKDTRYFKYEEKFYSQQKGLPMGSPASPVIADIVMEDLLDDSIGKMPNKPKILTKYVDDFFGIIKKTETINTINVLNSYNKLIQFTMEEENDNKLAYLDTIVIRKENRILLDWYQKDTASGRLVNFHSKHPKSMIINTANNFKNRVLTISDKIYHHQNKQKIRDILLMNDFPKKTIKDLLQRAQKPKKDNINKEPKIYKSVTFIPGFSERFKNSAIYDKDKIQLAFRTHNTMDQFYGKTKSKVKKEDKSNLVYQIKCNGDGSDICQKVYVGTTGTKLKTRISSHKSDHKARDKPLDQKTALATHCTQTGHNPNFDDVDAIPYGTQRQGGGF
ncbi:uncharacterized protein LOC142230761 [Haematobia irritans]|uniref:uncharacterized protein LOC142230761 n=1 Tax=Haematobia irritans TaxID=7368 RepID=UPI003F4F8B34